MATYYISNSGNNASDGLTTGTAWETLTYAASNSSSGDTLLLAKDSVFRESFDPPNGTSGSPTIIGAYGGGTNDPIIDGSIEVSTWTLDTGNIYYATIASEPNLLFVNGIRYEQSRFPKSGFLTTDSINVGLTEIIDADLTEADDYWNEASISVRTQDYEWEYSRVSDYVNSTGALTLSFALSDMTSGANERSYFFRNHRSSLTQAGEWCYVPSEGRVYLWMLDSSDPDLATIECDQLARGFGNFNKEYIQMSDITIRRFQEEGILCGGGGGQGNNTFTNISFEDNWKVDLWALGENHTFDSCSSTDCHGRSLFFFQVTNPTVTNTNISGTMPQEGVGGQSGVGGGIGIYMDTCTNINISECTISNTAYNGITANSDGGVVEKCIFLNTMQYLNDGAALYCVGGSTQDVTWRNNFCQGTKHNSSMDLGTFDYYVDNDCDNITVENNVSISPEHGSMLINADSVNCTIQNNILYEFTICGIQIADWASALTAGHVIEHNTFYTTTASATVILLQSAYGREESLGTFNNNIYANTANTSIAYLGGFGSGTANLTLTAWQSQQPSQNADSIYVTETDVYLVENRTDTIINIGNNYSDLAGTPIPSALGEYSAVLGTTIIYKVQGIGSKYSSSNGKLFLA